MIEVEEFCPDEVFSSGPVDDLLDPPSRDIPIDHNGQILAERRKPRNRGEMADKTSICQEDLQIQFGQTDRLLGILQEIKGIPDLGVDFPYYSRFVVSHNQLRNAAGMECWALRRFQMPLPDPQPARQRLDHTLEIEEIHEARFLLRPVQCFPRTSHGNAQTTKLARQDLLRYRMVNPSHFENGHLVRVPRVIPHRLQQAIHERAAHELSLAGQGIGQSDVVGFCRTGPLRIQLPHRVEVRDGIGDHLLQPTPNEHISHELLLLQRFISLLRRQFIRHQCNGYSIVAIHPDHLFNEVGRKADVQAVIRNSNRNHVSPLFTFKIQALQNLRNPLIGYLDSRYPFYLESRNLHAPLFLPDGIGIGYPPGDGPASELPHQFSGPLCGGYGHGGRNAPAESRRCLTEKLERL